MSVFERRKYVIKNASAKDDAHTHYSKSKRFVKNLNFDNPSTFRECFAPKFFDNFSREIKVVNSQKVQNHNIFTSFSTKKTDYFFGKSELNFWTKNPDFEQCDMIHLHLIVRRFRVDFPNFSAGAKS